MDAGCLLTEDLVTAERQAPERDLDQGCQKLCAALLEVLRMLWPMGPVLYGDEAGAAVTDLHCVPDAAAVLLPDLAPAPAEGSHHPGLLGRAPAAWQQHTTSGSATVRCAGASASS